MNERRAPTNTQNDDEQRFLLFQALVSKDPSDAIVQQEKRGQRSLVSSDTLPVEMDPETREALLVYGVTFDGPVPGDALFQYATLPKGWTKVATDHDMWSELRDANGVKRGGIFYKAAFYDRHTHIRCDTRFSYGKDYDHFREKNEWIGVVTDVATKTNIYETPPRPVNPEQKYEGSDEVEQQAKAWLNEHYPQWRTLTAYWEQE